MEEDKIKTEYGEVSLESGPVNPENPTFDSLLGALKAVYMGELKLEVLKKYHKSLSEQLKQSRINIQNIKPREDIGDEYKIKSLEQVNMSLGGIDIVQTTLDLLDEYIKDPTKEKMSACVESLVNSKAITAYLHNRLDENISLLYEN